MSGSNLKPFIAVAFADDDGHVVWENYGGVFFDDGSDYDWIEDSRGLTHEQAEELADLLNSIDDFCKPLMEIDMRRIQEVIADWSMLNWNESEPKGDKNGI